MLINARDLFYASPFLFMLKWNENLEEYGVLELVERKTGLIKGEQCRSRNNERTEGVDS